MRLALALAPIAVIAVLDAGFSGFRAALGRTGLIRHRARDLRAAVQGLRVGVALGLPAFAALAWCLSSPEGRDGLRAAAAAADTVLVPASAGVLVALAAYLLLPWELRYLASAVILGPFTWLRPAIALGSGLLAGFAAGRLDVWILVLSGTAAVLLVEPVAGRRWVAADGLIGPQEPPVTCTDVGGAG